MIGVFPFTVYEESGKRKIDFREDNNVLDLLIYNPREEVPREFIAADGNLRRHGR